jgi:CRP-like cAMP-binding protein
MSTTAALRLNPAFRAASSATLRALSRRAELGAWDDGRTILRAGERQRFLYVVGDGGFELYRKPRGDAEHVLLGHIEPPRLFGDATLFGSGVWPVSARAKGDTTAACIPAAAFLEALDDDAGLAAALYRITCRRLWRSIQIRKFMVLHDTEQQVLRLLLELAEVEGEGEPPIARVSQSRLARTLGINRSTAVRALKKLEARGLVELERGAVRVHFEDWTGDVDDAPGLARLAR